MAEYITRIRTEAGDLQIDYNALANKPNIDTNITSLNNNITSLQSQVTAVNTNITSLQNNKVSNTTTVNGKPLTGNIDLTASDVGAAETNHNHAMSDITSGVLSMSQGGTNAENGSDGLKNLLADGAMILSSHQYGNGLPNSGVVGQIFFVKVTT